MNEQQNIEETLWNYIDGTLTASDISLVERLLQADAQWKAKYSELLDVHQLMQNHMELEEPSMRFTQNVMEEISRLYITPAAKTYINKHIIRGIAIFFLSTIVALLGYMFGQVDWSQPPTNTGFNINYNITNPDWSKLFNSSYLKIFIMINIVLALMLLDMYLTKKKKTVYTE